MNTYELEAKYQKQEKFETEMKPKLLKYISNISPLSRDERDLLDYFESLVKEAFSYKNLLLMMDQVDDIFHQKVSVLPITRKIKRKISAYELMFD